MTTSGEITLREGDKAVGTVKDILVWIEKPQGDWVYVRTSHGQKGWLPQNQVVRLDKAETFFGNRIGKNPQDADAYYLRAAARFHLGQKEGALADIDHYLNLFPKDAMAYNWRGLIRQAKGQYDLALADFNRAISIGPAHAFYYDNAGRCRLDKEEYDQAIANFSQALRLDPKLPSAYQGRAIARAFKKGDPIEVFEDFGQARRLAPELYDKEGRVDWMFSEAAEAYEMAQDNLAGLSDDRIAQFQPKDVEDYSIRGWAWFENGNFAKAAEDYGEAMRRQPNIADWPRYRGWLFYEQGKSAAALADYDIAIRIDPKWVMAYNDRGVIRLRQGDYAAALGDFNSAIELNENNQLARLNRGWLHFRQRNCALAAADFAAVCQTVNQSTVRNGKTKFHHGWAEPNKPVNATTELEPIDAYVLSFRGQVRLDQGDSSGAMADFKAAENLDPQAPFPAYARAQFYLKQGDKEKAIAEFTKAIERCSEFARAYYDRGLVREGLKQYAEAAADIGSAIGRGMKTAAAYNARGWNLEQKGELDLALADFDEAVRLDANAAYILNNRGWLWVEKKDYNKAIGDLDKAIKLSPKWSWPLNNRGVARKNLRQFQEAMADYRAAIAADAKNAPAHSNLAWVLATCPDASLRDGKQALALAQKACELGDWKTAYALESLAAAYAETADFEQAVRWQTKAVELADAAVKEGYREKLVRYQAKEPWRDK